MSDALDTRLEAIETRNVRVAMDKAWETSMTRRLSIAALTYGCAAFYIAVFLRDDLWYLGALVPVMGYLLSTLSLPVIRKIWQKAQ